MRSLIIDISAAPIQHFLQHHGKLTGFLYALWFRFLRPVFVLTIWVFFALYIYHSLVTVGGSAAEVASLMGYILVVASIAGALVSWIIVVAFHNWIRARDDEVAAYGQPSPETRVDNALPVWRVPEGVRIVVVRHDENGNIMGVDPWQAPAIATPPTPIVLPASTQPWTVESTPPLTTAKAEMPALPQAPQPSLYYPHVLRRNNVQGLSRAARQIPLTLPRNTTPARAAV